MDFIESEKFFYNMDFLIKKLQQSIKTKNFSKIAIELKKLTNYIIEFRNIEPSDIVRNKLCHDFCNKITSINFAIEMEDMDTLDKSFNMLQCINNLFQCILCNKPLQANTIPRLSAQYSIEFYKQDWFINQEVSQLLIVGILLQNIYRVIIRITKDKFIIAGIYRNILEDKFFQYVCDNFHEYDNISIDFQKDQNQLVIFYKTPTHNIIKN